MTLTDKVIHSMSHHVGGFSGAVKTQVLGHRLLLLGRFTDLLNREIKMLTKVLMTKLKVLS